jgi:hypothetical protein
MQNIYPNRSKSVLKSAKNFCIPQIKIAWDGSIDVRELKKALTLLNAKSAMKPTSQTREGQVRRNLMA